MIRPLVYYCLTGDILEEEIGAFVVPLGVIEGFIRIPVQSIEIDRLTAAPANTGGTAAVSYTHLLTLEKGGSTYPDTPHEGEEFGYVLQGSLVIHVGTKSYKAKKGESFYFTPDKKHYLTSKAGAVLLWVSSPPSF